MCYGVIEMGYWKSNILFSLLLLGAIGYLIVERIVDTSFIYDPEFVVFEYGVIGELAAFIISLFIAALCAFSILTYLYRWWILIAMLILWLAIVTSKRRN